MAAGKGIQIVVGTDYNDRDLKRAQRDLDRLKSQAAKTAGPMAKLGNTLRANVGPALAMAAAAAGALAVKFAVDGVKAAAAEQAALATLHNTLTNLGQAFAIPGVDAFVDDLQRATGVADDELRPALQKLIVATGDAAVAQDLLTQALDISIGSGKSLDSVTTALAKAANGQTAALRRLFPQLSETALASGDLTIILGELNDVFGGSAAQAAKTFEGQLKKLEVAFSELQESFGKGFLDALGDTNNETDALMDSLMALEPAMYDLGKNIGTLVKMMADLEEQTGAVSTIFKAFLDITGPLLDAIIFFYRVVRNGEDPLEVAADQFFGLEAAGNAAADGMDNVGDAANNNRRAAGWFGEDMADLSDEAREAAESFNLLADAITYSGAIIGFQAEMDDARKLIKKGTDSLSIYNNKGRETVQGLIDLASATGKAAEQTDDLSGKQDIAVQGLGVLEEELNGVKLDPDTQEALLGPWQALIDDLEEAGVDTTDLQNRLDKLKSKTIEVKFDIVVTGDELPPGTKEEWYGTAVGGKVPKHFAMGGSAKGMDTIPAMLTPGEFVIRRQAVKQFGSDFFSQLNRGINPLAGMTPTTGSSGGGLTINGGITVQSAPGERAETSLPRALRRAAFLAGVNG
jgi:hypothetical protein